MNPARPRAVNPTEIGAALRRGFRVSESDFDKLLSQEAQLASSRFWTPVEVGRRAATLLEDAGVERVIDIGSGVGKACVVGALSTGLVFDGIERQPALVAEAESLAMKLGVNARVSFVCGTLELSSCDGYDGVYIFNPFAEQLYHLSEIYSHDCSNRVERLARDLAVFGEILNRVELGFRMVTYHGCGARIPDTFEFSHCEYAGTNVLRMWTKVRSTGRGGFWRERFETTELYAPNRTCEVLDCPGVLPNASWVDGSS